MAPEPNVLSIDVEDYYQVASFQSFIRFDDWPDFPSRVEANVQRVLDLLAEHHTHATFFVLGWTAEQCPGLVRHIADAGHEVASHGYAHQLVYQQTPEAFRADVRRAKDVLEDQLGRPVIGYRAPTFTIVKRTLWALDVLAEEGYRYDSSIFPVRHDRYGMPGANPHIHWIRGPQGGMLLEFPPLTRRLAGRRFPAAGGGYLRLLPLRWTAGAIRACNRSGHPAMVYVHPWELDPDQPRLEAKGLDRLRHYTNLARTRGRLTKLLERYRFGTAIDRLRPLLDERNGPAQQVVVETSARRASPAGRVTPNV